MNDLVTTGDPRDQADAQERNLAPAHMFQNRRDLGAGAAQGAIAIESERAIAEAQAAMVVAQRFRRDETGAYARMMDVCKRQSFAAQAFYSYKRGGSVITGPSIRMAEELARVWGNFQYGMLELSQRDGASEYQAFAHDLETNVRTYQNFTVNHIRDSGSGSKTLTDQRDIYEVGANNGARRMRARILALLPAWFVDDAVQACNETNAKKDAGIPLSEQIKKLAAYAMGKGVTTTMLEARLGHPLDQTQPAEIQTLRAVFTALQDGQTTIADEFVSVAAGEEKKSVVPPAKAEPKPAQTEPKKAAPAKEEPKKDEPKTEPKQAAPAAEAEPAAEVETPAEKQASETAAEAAPAAEATQTQADAPAAAGAAAEGDPPADMF